MGRSPTARTSTCRTAPGRASRGRSAGHGALPRATIEACIEAAKAARHRAYAPYSRYRVGAAVLASTGEIFAGCNVENASYGATLCAERTALASMVATGAQSTSLVVVVTRGPTPGAPCGICRQWLAEFGGGARVVLVAVDDADGGKEVARVSHTFDALLPFAFGPSVLAEATVSRSAGSTAPKRAGQRSPTKGKKRVF